MLIVLQVYLFLAEVGFEPLIVCILLASVEFPLFLLASQRSTPIRDWPLRGEHELWTWNYPTLASCFTEI